MGAETTIWVEVEIPVKFWRESYGVTGADALDNAEISKGERLTGRYTYNLEDTEETT
jgi:hypothetical protein